MLLISLIGLFFCLYVGRSIGVMHFKSLILYFWHLIHCFVYYFYSLNFGGDSLVYYEEAKDGSAVFDVGTAGVNFLTSILVNTFRLNEISTFLVFNIFGSIGLLYFYRSLAVADNKSKFIKKITWIVVLLPSVSFWSSAIGKDAISFLAVSLALWAALHLRKRLFTMFGAIALMLFVRPHIAGMMLLALTAALLFERKISKFYKLFLFLSGLGVSAIVIPFALNYVGLIEGVNFSELSEYVEARQGYNMEGGGGIDIGAMSLPDQMLAYVFRPSLLEVNSIFSLAAAFDNFILFGLFAVGGYHIFRGGYKSSGESLIFIWLYTLLVWIILSMTTANMGIALRQKWMFVPFLVFLLISAMPDKKYLTKS